MNYLNYSPRQGFGLIYKYTSPSGKNYIGETTYSLKERAGKDGKRYRNCSVFYAAIEKYGFSNFSVEILEEVLKDELLLREEYYIKKYNSVVPNGYNICKKGNKEGKGENRKTPIDVYDLECNFIASYPSLIEAAKAYNTSWQAISSCLTKKRPYHKGCIFVYKDEKPKKPKTYNTHGRTTAQYDLQDNLIAVYSSANQAARAIGRNSNAGRNIRSVCEGKRNTAFGYKWRYLE